MDHRNSRRTRKFYRQQVELILDLLNTHFEADSKKFEEYLAVCERLGKTPDFNKMPMDRVYFPFEVQLAFLIHELLPDRWEGMSGSYLGKDWSPVDTCLNIYNVKDKATVVFFLKSIDIAYSNVTNKRLAEERKKQERKSQGKDMSSMNFPKGK